MIKNKPAEIGQTFPIATGSEHSLLRTLMTSLPVYDFYLFKYAILITVNKFFTTIRIKMFLQ